MIAPDDARRVAEYAVSFRKIGGGSAPQPFVTGDLARVLAALVDAQRDHAKSNEVTIVFNPRIPDVRR